ncbi:MAG: hypothetical protein LW875_12480 [Proteobacteria bacterium]|jgi:hypothetical protein|nr:hypothetical protein [Pseudomonadota bacterium]
MRAALLVSMVFMSSISFANTINLGDKGSFQVVGVEGFDATDSQLLVQSKSGISKVIVNTKTLTDSAENEATKVSYGELLSLVATNRAEIKCFGTSTKSGNTLRVDSTAQCEVGVK